MTSTLIAAAFVALALAGVGALLVSLKNKFSRWARGPRVSPHYRIVKSDLMTANELRFFRLLEKAVPGAMIAPQVSMGALLRPAPYRGPGSGRFAAMRVDFVLYEAATGKAVCVIELDDSSHDNRRSKEKDRLRDMALTEAGYPWLRFDFRKGITVSQIRSEIRRVVG